MNKIQIRKLKFTIHKILNLNWLNLIFNQLIFNQFKILNLNWLNLICLKNTGHSLQMSFNAV